MPALYWTRQDSNLHLRIMGTRPPCYLALPVPRLPSSRQLFGLGSE